MVATPVRPFLEGKKLNKIEKNKAAKDGLLVGSQLEEFAAAGWENVDETDLQLRLKWYGMFWRPKTPGRFMLRLRLPNGIVSASQLNVIASLIARYGDGGSGDITTRQNIQLRGVLLEDLPDILGRLREAGITSLQSGFDNPRNVTGNPLAGIDPAEILDTRPHCQAQQDLLTNSGEGSFEFSNLPRKWNTAVAGAKHNFLLHNDIVFHPVEKDGVLGFAVWVGGVLSSQLNAYAVPLNAWIPLEEAPRMTDTVVKIWRDNGERNKRPRGRFRFYLDAVGVETFRSMVVERFGPLADDPGSAFNDRPALIYGIHPQKQEGFYYAGLHVPVGRLTAATLQELARLAEAYGDGEVRLTEDQNVIIPGIAAARIKAFKAEPLLQRFPLQPGAVSSGTVSCTGSTYCGFALTNTKDQALAIAEQLDAELTLPEEVRIHWTGCPNSCGQAYMGGIGLTGGKARTEDGMVEGYDICVGGQQGGEHKLGKLFRKGVPTAAVKDVVKDLLVDCYGATPKRGKATAAKAEPPVEGGKDPFSRFMNAISG